MKLTIFTPTYNRGYCLDRLYKSLCTQSNSNFIRLIVDDGSTDNTQELIENWIGENKIKIEYHYQSNAGKSMAHNLGVKLTKTELFVCVDSDDWLSNNAVDIVLANAIRMNNSNTGLLMPRKFIGKTRLQETIMPNINETTLYDAYEKYGMKGDTMLVFKTAIINQFEFPHFTGEKFMPETYIYDLIDTQGCMVVVKNAVYNCEYMEDGYTNNVARLLKRNPRSYIACVNQRLKLMDKTIFSKLKDSARYISMMFVLNPKRLLKDSVYPIYTLLALPIGWLVYIRKFKNAK